MITGDGEPAAFLLSLIASSSAVSLGDGAAPSTWKPTTFTGGDLEGTFVPSVFLG